MVKDNNIIKSKEYIQELETRIIQLNERVKEDCRKAYEEGYDAAYNHEESDFENYFKHL